MNGSIMIDADDVSVSKIELLACENCNEDAETHEVILDLRNMGETTSLFRGCSHCCDEYADRLRKGLQRIAKALRSETCGEV